MSVIVIFEHISHIALVFHSLVTLSKEIVAENFFSLKFGGMSQDSKLKKAKIEALIIIFIPQRQRKISPKKIILIFKKKT